MNTRTRELTLRILKYIVIAFAFISLALFFYQCMRNINKFAQIDLTSYIRASQWFFAGDNPFQEVSRRYVYPLFLLLIVYPFQFLVQTPLQKAVTAAFWSAGLYLSFFLTLAAVWKRIYGYPSLREALARNITAIAVMVLLVHPSMQDEFLNGQVNLLVMGATAAFFVLIERNKLWWAAVFLAGATAIKIAPALCLLYVLFDRKYRVVFYYVPLVGLLTVGLPLLINPRTLEYYRYFITDVMPRITGSDFEGGFRSFSVISTVSYLFRIHWYPPMKILVTGILAASLVAPIVWIARRNFTRGGYLYRLTVFGAIVSVIPLTFPMSEAHHLLLQIIPLIAVIAYWRHVLESGHSVLRDRLSLLLIVAALGLHIGHGLKDTPIRLISLICFYCGMVLLLRIQPDAKEENENAGRG